MKNKIFTASLIFIATFTNLVFAQTIDEIIIPGATSSNNGTSWDVEFYSSTNTTTNANNYKEIKVVQTGTKGEYLVWDASNKTDWQVVMGQPTSGSWKSFCYPILENDVACNGKCTVSYYIRHIGTTAGQQTTSITLGLNSSNNCAFSSGSPSFTIAATVNKVASTGIYTWIEPATGTDSSYKIAGNWSPTRTTISTDDILVVDLAQTSTVRNTTIDISNLTESINQFKIFPYNNVTFRCTANTAWTVGKATSTSGDDFIVDLNGGIRKSGVGILEIIIPTGNTATINSKLAVATNPSGTNSGTLLFSGAGAHSIAGNIHVDGGTLSFKPTTINNLLLNGSNQTLNGTGGTLYIDSLMFVTIGTGSANTFTLNRSLPLYSKLTLLSNTTIASNSPASSSAADWNSWTPHLQFKWFDKVGSKAFGELGVMPTGAAITGGALVEILNSTRRAYRTVGIPLKNAANLSQFVDDIHLTGTVTDAANKDSFTTSCTWCKSSIFRWNEATAGWTAYTSGTSANKIDPGKGVLVFFRGARDLDHGLGDTNIVANKQIIDFKGQIQTGNLTVSGLAKTNVGSSLEGANLIANPYPSTLNFRSFYEGNTTKILPRYYTYDALAKNYNSWDSSIGTSPLKGGASWFQSAGADTRYINPGAAFFVFARNNNESVSFTEAMKEASKRSKGKNFGVEELKETPCNEFKMTVNYVNDTAFESDGFTMQYDLNISEVSNDGEMYDAPKFYGGHLGLGTTTANNQWLAVDRRTKLAELGNTHTLPLKVAYPKTGPTDLFFTIKSCSFGNGPYKIQLVDKVLNTVEEVGDNSIYQYSINSADERRQDRFEVLFTAVENLLNTKQITKETKDFVVYPNPAVDGQFNIVNNKQNKIQSIEIYNAQGQCIKVINHCSNDLIPVALHNVSAGIYSAKITGQNGIESHTIVLP